MKGCVVHLCRSAQPRIGGLEAALSGLVRAQRASGMDVRVVSLRDPEVDHESPLALEGVELLRLVRVGSPRYPFALGLSRALYGARLVHVHGVDGLLDQVVCRARPFAVGVSTHGGYFHTDRQALLKAALARTWTARALGRADAIWYTSEGDQRRLAPAGRPGRVLPNGIDLERFSRVVRQPRPGLVVCVSRLAPHKGIDDLIDALPEAVRARPDLSLWIAGPEGAPGISEALLSRAAARGVSDRVRLLGSLTGEALLVLLGEAERAIFPSRYEGQGLALIEAMAARVPVIASPIDAFLVHSECVDIVDVRRPGALADALRRPASDEQTARAAQRAEGYGWQRRAADFEAAYEEILS